MKYCDKCGSELFDDAVICPKCGCATGVIKKSSSGMSTLINILMIINCVIAGCALIPLAWCIPMTVHYYRAVKDGRDVSVGFKVCVLLFVNLLAGILMFCDNQD